MKKLNIVLGILFLGVVLILSMKPVEAQALNVVGQSVNGELPMILTSVLTPLWYIVGKKVKRFLD